MKVTESPFFLAGSRGESVTVEIQSTGTEFLVTYELNGSVAVLRQGSPLSFRLELDPTILTLSFSFSNPQGGAYAIRIPANGDISEHILQQPAKGETPEALTYTFHVEGGLAGDETKRGY